MKSRNYGIDFLKLYYIFIILIYHFYGPTDEKLIGGTYGVEFFLLTTGAYFFEPLGEDHLIFGENSIPPHRFFLK